MAMSDKQVMIEAANLDRIDSSVWPAGIIAIKTKVNYALAIGLQYLEAHPTPGNSPRIAQDESKAETGV